MRQRLLLGIAILTACGPSVPDATPPDGAEPSVLFEPAADAAQVSNVVHLHVASPTLSSQSVSLFQGVLTSYHLGKLKHGEIPEPLMVRQVPTVSFRSGAELVVAPLRVLPLGQYSLASTDGLLKEFQVTASLPLLDRVWPPEDTLGTPRFAVYCGEPTHAAPNPTSLIFEPSKRSVELLNGVGEGGPFAERCLYFRLDATLEAGEILVPPPEVGMSALAPALFSELAVEPVVPLLCGEGEQKFGPGCALVADDRMVVRTPEAGLLWVVHTERGALVEVTRAGSPLTVRGFAPDESEHLWGTTYDESGTGVPFDLVVRTAPARERPILSEALADALGPEPQSEWIEVFNDGTLAVDLSNYSLQDGGGRTALPAALLPPQTYALLVRQDFAPNGSDAPPRPETLLVRLPALGKGGLSNSGERLALLDQAGVERSVLPALTGKPGQSLARRTPAAPDDDPKSFSFGVPTPGFANEGSPPRGAE